MFDDLIEQASNDEELMDVLRKREEFLLELQDLRTQIN